MLSSVYVFCLDIRTMGVVFTKPLLVMTLGLPGSGKSFFARQFAEKTGSVHIRSDEIRQRMFAEPKYTKSENEAVFGFMDFMADAFLEKGISVVYDANNNRRQYRQNKLQLAKKHDANSIIVWLQTDENTAASRASNRDKRRVDDKFAINVSKDVFARLKKNLQKPYREDYVVTSGKYDFKVQLKTVVNKLMKLGYALDESRLAPRVVKKQSKPINASASNKAKLGGRVDQTRRRTSLT